MTLREAGYSCDMNQIGRSMKAQMKQADRTGARFALIFGEEERSRGAVTVRNMADSSQEENQTIRDCILYEKGRGVKQHEF